MRFLGGGEVYRPVPKLQTLGTGSGCSISACRVIVWPPGGASQLLERSSLRVAGGSRRGPFLTRNVGVRRWLARRARVLGINGTENRVNATRDLQMRLVAM